MNERQKYLFDLQGYVLVEDVLNAEECELAIAEPCVELPSNRVFCRRPYKAFLRYAHFSTECEGALKRIFAERDTSRASSSELLMYAEAIRYSTLAIRSVLASTRFLW